jgi:hypothetical protein
MKVATVIIAVSTVLVATAAQAQDVNLTGRWQCMRICASDVPGQLAFITQYGRELNVVNEVGMASRAWVDYPGRIWIDRAQVGAVYAPDGMTIQFDNGTIWQRAVELPPPAPLAPRRR